jgi:hypothetical protein
MQVIEAVIEMRLEDLADDLTTRLWAERKAGLKTLTLEPADPQHPVAGVALGLLELLSYGHDLHPEAGPLLIALNTAGGLLSLVVAALLPTKAPKTPRPEQPLPAR